MILEFMGVRPQIDETAYIAETAVIIGDVTIGANAFIGHCAVLRGDCRRIIVGARSNIQDNCVLHCGSGHDLVIGEGVTVGHAAILHSTTVGDGSLIGMGSTLLDGSVVGKECMVGANALVTGKTVIPDRHLAVGSPAAVKKELDAARIESMRENAEEYVRLAALYKAQQVK